MTAYLDGAERLHVWKGPGPDQTSELYRRTDGRLVVARIDGSGTVKGLIECPAVDLVQAAQRVLNAEPEAMTVPIIQAFAMRVIAGEVERGREGQP